MMNPHKAVRDTRRTVPRLQAVGTTVGVDRVVNSDILPGIARIVATVTLQQRIDVTDADRLDTGHVIARSLILDKEEVVDTRREDRAWAIDARDALVSDITPENAQHRHLCYPVETSWHVEEAVAEEAVIRARVITAAALDTSRGIAEAAAEAAEPLEGTTIEEEQDRLESVARLDRKTYVIDAVTLVTGRVIAPNPILDPSLNAALDNRATETSAETATNQGTLLAIALSLETRRVESASKKATLLVSAPIILPTPRQTWMPIWTTI
jgi:hypothetical protein